MSKTFHYVFIMFIFTCIELSAQETVDTSGGKATGSGGSINYSIGQLLTNSKSGSNGSQNEGVQQSIELLTLGIEDDLELVTSLRVYPNPTTDHLKINLGFESYEGLSYTLHNINGNLIKSMKIEAHSVKVAMSTLSPALYILSIKKLNNTLKTFRILKH